MPDILTITITRSEIAAILDAEEVFEVSGVMNLNPDPFGFVLDQLLMLGAGQNKIEEATVQVDRTFGGAVLLAHTMGLGLLSVCEKLNQAAAAAGYVVPKEA